ncbi:MAG TPA: helix-turn-helix domain-containing protein [Candidatus Saccharimonadales bacterium]|nr:helix-turn-helix domain-containing protein [Candidatus Saccharimonadales bacterium]
MQDADRFKAIRVKPSQARGKERVRITLAAALKVFQEQGFVSATTNDIAERAKIPIGSLYRYFPNKEALLLALVDLYVTDVNDLFENIAKHPLFPVFSWNELLLLTIDAWLHYMLLNGPFDFMYSAKANPEIGKLTRPSWLQQLTAFDALLRKRDSLLTGRQTLVAYRLAVAAVDLGSDIGFIKHAAAEPAAYYEAVQAVALYVSSVSSISSTGNGAR